VQRNEAGWGHSQPVRVPACVYFSTCVWKKVAERRKVAMR